MTVASVNKRTTESKYVSCFTDSRPDVDITFRDVLLSRPTDHYLVGVDNFSLTSTSLSMIEPSTGDYQPVIRIVRNATAADWNGASDLDGNLAGAGGRDLVTNATLGATSHIRVPGPPLRLRIDSNEVILNIQQLLHRLSEVANHVNSYMDAGGILNAAGISNEELKRTADGGKQEIGWVPAGSEEHLKFSVRPDGRLMIHGTRAFWANFSIAVPNPQYQFGIYGDRKSSDDTGDSRLRRYLSVHPATGAQTFNKIRVNPVYSPGESANWNSRTLHGTRPKVFVVPFDSPDLGGAHHATTFPDIANADIYSSAGAAGSKALEVIVVTCAASIFSTMERRVCLELGASLPIKNSPMIDHQREAPDFVLGRWIWKTSNSIETTDEGDDRRYRGPIPVCTEYQGAQDRITYHELQAQAKIQTVRLKLFARVRTFNTKTEAWGMRVVELPTNTTDWWHARLHFVSKD